MTFKVMKDRCDQCLYGSNKIVSNKRRAEILRDINERDTYFVCHKASIAGKEIGCGGDWKQRQCGRNGRMAQHFGVIEFVDAPEKSTEA